jgi:chromosome segregation ATPase
LGVTVDAIRSRVKRGTIAHVREGGRVYVLLGADQDRPGHDQGGDRPGESGALISQMQGHIDSLERQLEQANERDRENRRIIAALTSRIPELEAAPEERESPETVEEASDRAQDELGAERVRREMAESTLREGMAEQRRRREEAERERDELRRQLYARREPQESPQTSDEQQGRGRHPQSAAGGAQESARRPWWRRVLRR